MEPVYRRSACGPMIVLHSCSAAPPHRAGTHGPGTGELAPHRVDRIGNTKLPSDTSSSAYVRGGDQSRRITRLVEIRYLPKGGMPWLPRASREKTRWIPSAHRRQLS